ncbi:MAG: ParA family protein [Anaerolineae bacterium]|jgi:chromosome partitioning protein|nr:ParA family protein [Anaerolineae bacterium]
MKVLSCSNQKGGTGKTTTAQNVGYILAEQGLRILLIDNDPQSSLSRSTGIHDASGRSMAQVYGGIKAGKLSIKSGARDLGKGKPWIMPSDIELSFSEMQINSRIGRERILSKALESVRDDFDLVLIDCPPSMGWLTLNALGASDAVLVITQPQAVDLRGVALFLDTLETLRDELNPDLELMGILVTFFDSRITHHKEALKEIEREGLPLLPVQIGRSIRVAEAAGAGLPVTEFAPNNPQAKNYHKLAEEVRSWLEKTQD